MLQGSGKDISSGSSGEARPSSGIPDDAPVKNRPRKSWWWGVIPAVAAVVILIFWATGQFEEVFGIDPRGRWVAESQAYNPSTESGETKPTQFRVVTSWDMIISTVAGDTWLKLSRNGKEILAGKISIDENNIYMQEQRGTFNGVYFTDAPHFRYSAFAKRYIDAVVRLGPGEAYSLRFERK
jgi:hypothetical protein